MDPLEVALEDARNAKAGNQKLAKALEVLRGTLETIVVAEFDHTTQLPTTARDLRMLAAQGLDEYSRLVGQSWRRNPLIASRVGDKDLSTLEE